MSRMDLGLLSRRKQLLSAIAAAGLLVGIFVPFQSAQGATVQFSTAGGAPIENETFAKSGAGLPITIEITLAPGEVLDFEVPVSITPGLPNSGAEGGSIFLDSETFVPTPDSGSPESLFKDIEVEFTEDEYGYGYAATDSFVGPATITINATLQTSALHQGNPSSSTEQVIEFLIAGSPTVLTFNIAGS